MTAILIVKLEKMKNVVSIHFMITCPQSGKKKQMAGFDQVLFLQFRFLCSKPKVVKNGAKSDNLDWGLDTDTIFIHLFIFYDY